MKHDADAARARAEASFRKPDRPVEPADDGQALRERTARLREQRLAREAVERKAVEGPRKGGRGGG